MLDRSKSLNDDLEDRNSKGGKVLPRFPNESPIREPSKSNHEVLNEHFLEKPDDRKKRILNQTKVYLITYLAYTVIHLEK